MNIVMQHIFVHIFISIWSKSFQIRSLSNNLFTRFCQENIPSLTFDNDREISESFTKFEKEMMHKLSNPHSNKNLKLMAMNAPVGSNVDSYKLSTP